MKRPVNPLHAPLMVMGLLALGQMFITVPAHAAGTGSVNLATSIAETLSMTLTGTTTSFGQISNASVSTASPNSVITVGTNAARGYQVVATGTALTSASSSIPWVTDGGVNGLVGTTPTSEYGLQQIACTAGATCPVGDQSASSGVTMMSRAGGAASDSVTVSYRAQAKPDQAPASTYSSTVNYVVVGLF